MMGTGLFLVALGLIQTCLAQVTIPVQPGFQYRRLAGAWYAQAVVSRRYTFEVVAPKLVIFPLPNGGLDWARNDAVGPQKICQFVEYRFENDGPPGEFKVYEKAGGAPVRAHVVATNYTEYMVLHLKKGRYVALYLFGRGMEAYNDARRQFNHYRTLLRVRGTVRYPRLDGTCNSAASLG